MNKDEPLRVPLTIQFGEQIGEVVIWDKKFLDIWAFDYNQFSISYSHDRTFDEISQGVLSEISIINSRTVPPKNYDYNTGEIKPLIGACPCVICSGYCGCGIEGHHGETTLPEHK